MTFHGEINAAIGKRVSIRLREKGDELFRDLLGVLQSETTIITKDGSAQSFDIEDIAFFRVVPVFNRRDAQSRELEIYDTRTRTLAPICAPGEEATIYCCGPTVYRDAHVGNMRTFLLSDLVSRALEISGHQVRLVQNITDVGHMSENLTDGDDDSEDKVLQESKKQSISAAEVAAKYEELFHRDLAALNIRPADFYPRASQSMELIIGSIEKLITNNAAYIGSDGNVYFDSSSFSTYGAISGNKLDELKPGHRYEYTGDGGKRFHADWALWKVARDRTDMVWPSPWGVGFPGWHIECTAMSLELLGDSIDLHIGGIDLRFPHHENERAQTNSIAKKDVVANWLHGEHLLFEGKKMAKSSGNVVLVSDISNAGLDPLSLRLALLENRYRSQMDLTWDSLRAADATLKRWRKAMSAWGNSDEVKFDGELNGFMMRDLDTPKVILKLRAIEKDATIGEQDKRALFLYADQLLGLDLTRSVPPEAALSHEVEILLQNRATARAEKNWAEADLLRDQLATLGIAVRDGVDGQSWERIN